MGTALAVLRAYILPRVTHPDYAGWRGVWAETLPGETEPLAYVVWLHERGRPVTSWERQGLGCLFPVRELIPSKER